MHDARPAPSWTRGRVWRFPPSVCNLTTSPPKKRRTANTKRGKQLLFAASGKKRRGRPPINPDGRTNKRQRSDSTSSSPKPSAAAKKSGSSTASGRIRRVDMGCSGHIVDECVARLAPLDGLPLICSFTSEAAKRAGLTDAQRLLLNQVELFVLPPHHASNDAKEGAVGLRDRNTLASTSGCHHVLLNSVEDVGRDVLLLNSEHLVSCRLVRGRESRVLQGLVGGDNSNLVRYCRYVAAVYSMVDRDGYVAFDDSPGEFCVTLTWQCLFRRLFFSFYSNKKQIIVTFVIGSNDTLAARPEVTGEYVTPDDVDAVAILDRPMPGLEVEAPDAPSPEKPPASSSGTLTRSPGAPETAPAEKMATAVRLEEKPSKSQLAALPEVPAVVDAAAAAGAGASAGSDSTAEGAPPAPEGSQQPPARALPQDAPRPQGAGNAVGKIEETASVGPQNKNSSSAEPPACAPAQDTQSGSRGPIASSSADEMETDHGTSGFPAKTKGL